MTTPQPSAPLPQPTLGHRPGLLSRKYLIDARTQFRVAGMLICGVVVIATVHFLTLFTSFDPPADGIFDSAEVRALLLKLGLLQFAVTSVMLLVLGLLVSHRFVGATLVLRRALRGMLAGDTTCRLTLRQTDFLHDLASDLGQVRDQQVQRQATLEAALERAEAAIASGSLPEARSQLAHARRALAPANPVAAAEGAAAEAAPTATPAPTARETASLSAAR